MGVSYLDFFVPVSHGEDDFLIADGAFDKLINILQTVAPVDNISFEKQIHFLHLLKILHVFFNHIFSQDDCVHGCAPSLDGFLAECK